MSTTPDLRRVLRQTLELYRQAGIEQLPLVVVPGVAASQPAARPAQNVAVPSRANTPSPTRPPERRPAFLQRVQETSGATVPTTTNPPAFMPRASTPAFVPPPPPAPLPQSASREERAAALAVLNQHVRGCKRCVELAEARTNTVFGSGDPGAKILFLGEAPGADEDAQGEPFVGKSGQLLTTIIEACLLKRKDIYICNILKCRPPGNRTPLELECLNCREYLDGQLSAIDPEYIVCWGTTAAQNLLQTKQPIGKLRQQFFRHGRAKVLCTYHPSYLIRNPPAKKDVWEDMKFWRAEMGVDLSNVKKAN